MQVHEFDSDLAMELTTPEGQVQLQGILDDADEDDLVSRGRDFNEFIVNYQEVYYDYNEETGHGGHHLRADPPLQLPAELLLQAHLRCAMSGR